MPWTRLKRAADSKADSHWRSNVLTGTMCAWAEVCNHTHMFAVALHTQHMLVEILLSWAVNVLHFSLHSKTAPVD